MPIRARPGEGAGRGRSPQGDARPARPKAAAASRALGFCATWLGVLLLFASSLLAGALLHLDAPAARAMVAREVEAILAPVLPGRVRIDRLGGLGLFGLSRADVTVDDPRGRPVLVARGVRARVAVWAALRSALFEKSGPLTIRLPQLAIDSADVRLDTDPSGRLDLVDAFAPAAPSEAAPANEPASAGKPAAPGARGFELVLSRIVLGRLRAHGRMAGAPPLDADLRDFAGSFVEGPDVLEGDVFQSHITVHRIVHGADVDGSLRGRVVDPAKSPIEARVAWTGAAGRVATSIRLSLAGGKLDAVVDVPEVQPSDLRTIWPASAVDRPAQIHLEAHGDLPAVRASLRARVGAAALSAEATIVADAPKHADVSFEAAGIDIHELAPSAPRSRLALRGTARAALTAGGALDADLAMAFLGGRIGDTDLPAATVTAALERRAPNELRARLDAAIHEPGAPTHLRLRMLPNGASPRIAFELTSEAPDLERVPQLGRAVGGRAGLRAAGTFDLGAMTVDATVSGHAENVARGATRMEGATVAARVHGKVAAPWIDATIRSKGLLVAGRRVAQADATAIGEALSPHIVASVRGPDIPDVDASVDLGLRGGVSGDGLRVSLARAGERAVLTARRVSTRGGAWWVDDARLEGAGAPLSASASASAGEIRLRASSAGLDLGRLARLAGAEKNVHAGTLALDADVDLHRTEAKGHGTVGLVGAAIGTAQPISAEARFDVDGRRWAGELHARAGGLGALDVGAPEIRLAGAAPLLETSWRDAFGALDVDAHVDLAKAAALVPADEMPLGEARGSVALRAHLVRSGADGSSPQVLLSVATSHLAIAPKTPPAREIDGVLVLAPPPWRLEGIDFLIDANVDAATGASTIATRARDVHGDLAELRLLSPKFPYADLFSHGGGRLAQDLRTTPFELSASLPERNLSGLPALLRQDSVVGTLRADVHAKGTALDPDVEVAAALEGARFSGDIERKAPPLDVHLAAHYDGRTGSVSVKATSGKATPLDVTGRVEAVAAQLFEGGGPPRWNASAAAHFDRFPLEAITALGDRLVSGALSGDLSMAGLHEDARARAALTVQDLKIGSFTYASARLEANAGRSGLDAAVRIDQNDGFAEARTQSKARWGAAILPELDRSRPLVVTLASRGFRIAVLQPFVEGVLDELDGRLDSDARAEIDPSTGQARLSGHVSLSRGTVEAVAGGGEFHDISGSFQLAPDGTVTIEQLRAEGLTGRLEARGTAHLSGLKLQSADAVVVIPAKSAIPLSAGGTEVGNVDGRIEATATSAEGGRRLNVDVEVPHLRVALPQASTTSAYALGPLPRVHTGAHRGEPLTFVAVPLDPPAGDQPGAPSATPSTRLLLTANLADVQVVRTGQIKVDLHGKVNVASDATTNVSGQIQLERGGVLTIQGKSFTVEDGTVTLVGPDPANPEIIVKAGWTAPDGTVVYANFAGPLKTGKVTLQSEPPLPRDEIVQLLLYGTTDGQQGAQSPSAATSAVGTAGGQAAQPLNHMLNELGLGAITTTIDTTQSASPKPEVEVQIARDISLQVAVVIAQPPPGVNPDRTLVTLDWRLTSRWSLASTVGDAGTTVLDLLWRRRY